MGRDKVKEESYSLQLEYRIAEVERRMAEACARSGRNRSDVQVVAVTKTISAEATEEVIRQGLIHIGENRVQDADRKWQRLGSLGIWHFIGSLQTNKVKDVIGKFQYVHSLDRLSLAKEIDKRAASLDTDVSCFIQVNVSGERSKQGIGPDELFAFAASLKQFTRIRPIGLMTMAPFDEDQEAVRPVFRRLRELRDELNERRILPELLPHLSMGMSNDFETAIEEGATWVRLGTVLVGSDGQG